MGKYGDIFGILTRDKRKKNVFCEHLPRDRFRKMLWPKSFCSTVGLFLLPKTSMFFTRVVQVGDVVKDGIGV